MTRDEIKAIVSGPGKTSRWIMRHLDYAEPDWCLIYPFAWEVDHYPKYRNGPGRPHYPVHRLMCEYRHGPPPSPSHHSAHSCGRGTLGCVNPMHVSWKTPSENQKDRNHTGTPQRKLSPLDIDQIRALEGRAKPAEIAKQFGVSLRNIRLILAGETWKDDADGRRIFTAEEVLTIRAMRPLMGRGKLTGEQIAKQYGSTATQIYRILNGQSYGWVTAS